MYELVMTRGGMDTLTAPCEWSCSWPTQGPGQERLSLTPATGEQRMLARREGTLAKLSLEPY